MESTRRGHEEFNKHDHIKAVGTGNNFQIGETLSRYGPGARPPKKNFELLESLELHLK